MMSTYAWRQVLFCTKMNCWVCITPKAYHKWSGSDKGGCSVLEGCTCLFWQLGLPVSTVLNHRGRCVTA